MLATGLTLYHFVRRTLQHFRVAVVFGSVIDPVVWAHAPPAVF